MAGKEPKWKRAGFVWSGPTLKANMVNVETDSKPRKHLYEELRDGSTFTL